MDSENNYRSAVAVDGGIYAVELSAGEWGVADGPGSVLCELGKQELAGWHLPVRFGSEELATQAIRSAPFVMFDISADSVWTQHCIKCGARPV